MHVDIVTQQSPKYIVVAEIVSIEWPKDKLSITHQLVAVLSLQGRMLKENTDCNVEVMAIQR